MRAIKTRVLPFLTVLALGFYLYGCSWFGGAAETRARQFIQMLVAEPDNQEGLRAVSVVPAQQGVETLVDDLIAQVSVNYLRAKHGQGVALAFAVDSVRVINDREKIVVIGVDEGDLPSAGRVRFRVDMEKSADRGWLVKHVQAAS